MASGSTSGVAPSTAHAAPESPPLFDLPEDMGDLNNWCSQIGVQDLQPHDAGYGMLDASPAPHDHPSTQLPVAACRARNSVPTSVFQSGDAFPSLAPSAPKGSPELENLDARRKLESWERRSSEPNPVTARLPGSPSSPAEFSLQPNGGMANASLMQHTDDLESGALDTIGRYGPERPVGIQRRRGGMLRRGGSSRSYYESECLTADLSVQLEKALAANAMLEVRNQLLEEFVGLQAKHSAPGGAPQVVHSEAWWLDSVTRQMVEQRLNLSGMLTFTLRSGKPINLTRDQVAALSWREFCKLWQDYMKALQEGLAEVQAYAAGSQQPSSPLPQSQPGKRLARLVYETGILRGCLQTASPNRHADLLCFLPEGEPRPPYPTVATWQKISASLGITANQRAQLAQLRVMYLDLLGRMTRQRLQLVANLQAALPISSNSDTSAAGYEAALDGVEAIRSVLRDEHSLLTQYKMIVWGRVFTPIQAAVVTVEAYPWAADLPAIVNCIADDMGEPSCEDLLAGRP